jgi:hypothetical protein
MKYKKKWVVEMELKAIDKVSQVQLEQLLIDLLRNYFQSGSVLEVR